jgi:LysR family hydrogen peroxide-inducible transcriptional activator
VVARLDHPLLGTRKKTFASIDVKQHDVLLLEDGHCLRNHALAACGLSGLHETARFQANSLYTLVEMVANSLGAAFSPKLPSQWD